MPFKIKGGSLRAKAVSGDFGYEEIGGEITLISLRKGVKNVVVPESLDEIMFSENSASFDNTLFKSKQANHTITHVVNYDNPNFKECRSLKSVVLTDGVKEIGNNAFWSCVSLNRAVIGDGAEGIGKLAFYNCESLAEIVIGRSVKRIDEFAFYNCKALKTVFFHGTEKEWENISIMHGNESLLFAARYYYSEAASEHGDDF